MNAAAALARIEEWAATRGLDFRHDPANGSGAVYSACGKWRYLLWRIESRRAGLIGMGLLNPSTADHLRDDPTIRQCRMRARQAGAKGVLVWNLFAYRATKPADLKRAADPVGPDNDEAIALAAKLTRRTVLAWGTHGGHRRRDEEALAIVTGMACALWTLGLTAKGRPRHPLYLPTETRIRRAREFH
ncbi:MAG: DUF1643 domain-containing protein [Novosphingobium sp.]